MQVELRYEIKVTRGNEVERSEFTRVLTPSECFTATVAASTTGVTVDTSHMEEGATLILNNRDDSNNVTARLTRHLGSFTYPANYASYSISSGVPFASINAAGVGEQLRLGDFADQGFEAGIYLRTSGTQGQDGSRGVAEVTDAATVENHLVNLFRGDPFLLGAAVVPTEHTVSKEVPLDVEVPAGVTQVVDNVYAGASLVLTSALGTPLVDIILIGS